MSTMSLNEVLQKKAEFYGAEARMNKELIDEWIGAIEKLFAQLREWLTISDPSHILQIDERKLEVKEPNVGRYQAPRLDIQAFGMRKVLERLDEPPVKKDRQPKANDLLDFLKGL